MKTIGERLAEAIGLWDGGGIMAFVKALGGIRGGTYPAVKRYVDGDTEPSLRFLDKAATVLGVDFGWLAVGAGGEEPPTPKTIPVRAAVVADPATGRWAFAGRDYWSDVDSVHDARKQIGLPSWAADTLPTQTYFITAEIPIRAPAEVEAEVEGSPTKRRAR